VHPFLKSSGENILYGGVPDINTLPALKFAPVKAHGPIIGEPQALLTPRPPGIKGEKLFEFFGVNVPGEGAISYIPGPVYHVVKRRDSALRDAHA